MEGLAAGLVDVLRRMLTLQVDDALERAEPEGIAILRDGLPVAVGTALSGAPRTDPSVQNYRTGLLPRVLASKRASGQACCIRGFGIHLSAKSRIRSHVSRFRWLRGRSACRQWRVT